MKATGPERGEDDSLAVWRALADPCRRRILDLLRGRPLRTGDLAERFHLSRFGVMKHLTVLTEAGLVVVRRQGRERWNHLNPVPIQQIARRWIRPYEALRADALLRLKDIAENKGEEDMTTAVESAFQVHEVRLRVRIEASRQRVWDSLTGEIGRWWPADFCVGAPPGKFVVEPRVGGRIYEDWGEGQGATFATILKIRRGESMQWASDLDGACGGPGRSYITFELREEDGGTVVDLHDVTWGRVSEGGRQETEKGWRLLLEDAMKPYAEGNGAK